MPSYGSNSLQDILNDALARLRAVERLHFEAVELVESYRERCLSWQSTFALQTGLGHKFYSPDKGKIVFVRAERSAADGTSTAILDLTINGTSVFSDGVLPTVPAGEGLGPTVTPYLGAGPGTGPASRTRSFKRDDAFQVNVVDTGGGSGPLRLTIHFIQDPPSNG